MPPGRRNLASLPLWSWQDLLAITHRQRCLGSCWSPPFSSSHSSLSAAPALGWHIPSGVSQLPCTWLLGWSLVPHQADSWSMLGADESPLSPIGVMQPQGFPGCWSSSAAAGSGMQLVGKSSCGHAACWGARCSSTHFLCPLLWQGVTNCPWQHFCSVQGLILRVRALLASNC